MQTHSYNTRHSQQQEQTKHKERSTCMSFATFIWNCTKLYIFWITTHFIVANCYVYFCAHPTLFGFIISPLVVAAPHCKAMQWLLYHSVAAIDHMWLVLGGWVSVNLLMTYKNND